MTTPPRRRSPDARPAPRKAAPARRAAPPAKAAPTGARRTPAARPAGPARTGASTSRRGAAPAKPAKAAKATKDTKAKAAGTAAKGRRAASSAKPRSARASRAARPARPTAPSGTTTRRRPARPKAPTATRRSTGRATTRRSAPTTTARRATTAGAATARRSPMPRPARAHAGAGRAALSAVGAGLHSYRVRTREPRPRTPLLSFKWRLVSLVAVFVLIFAAVVLKQVDLQVVSPDRYNEWGMRQRLVSVTLPAGRGSLVDRNGEDLALSIPQTTVYADPTKVKDPEGAAQKLAPLLHREPAELEALLRTPKARFVYLARQVDDLTALAVRRLELAGVVELTEAKRFDPSGQVGRSVIGSTDVDGKGISGLERQYDDILMGRPGKLSMERAGGEQGGTIATGRQQVTPARPGRDVILTIDRSLQFETERVLGDQVKATGAHGGIVVVMRPSTGEIVALANMTRDEQTGEVVPSSDNAAATTMFEPGSVTKVITVSGAVNEGEVTPESTLEVPGDLQVEDVDFLDDEPHGVQTMSVTDILAQSSNIGTILLAKQLGKDRLNDYLRRFGLGARTDLDFPNEAAGILKDPSDPVQWSGTDIGSVPIGQGISVTAVQMLSAFNVIANGGMYVAPKLVSATVDPDGTRHVTAPSSQHRVIRSTTAHSVQDMMIQVVKNGTGVKAAVPGYTVAGKTGTARKPLPTGGYKDAFGQYHYVSTFAGFVPGAESDLSVIVVMDEPQTSIYAAEVAAPVFSKLAGYAVRQLHIPPTASSEPSTDATEIVVDNQPPAPVAPDPATPSADGTTTATTDGTAAADGTATGSTGTATGPGAPTGAPGG